MYAIKTINHFVDYDPGVEIFSTEKERRVFEVALPWWVANDLTWGIKGLSGGPGVGVNYTD